jgi:hypothetical protein
MYQCLDEWATWNWTANLYNYGFETFVIGVGNDVADWDWVMTDIATYGGTENYYPATESEQLENALQEIINELIPCTFEVIWDDVPDESSSGQFVDKGCDKVRVYAIYDLDDPSQNVELDYSHDCAILDGWRWLELPDIPFEELHTYTTDECETIELCEGACDNLQSGLYESISAGFGCEPGAL